MADLTLGSAPKSVDVLLSRDADFVSALNRKDGTAWPATAIIKIVFVLADATTIEWTATKVGASARFSVDQDDVNQVIAAKPRKTQIWYIDGASELLWFTGKIKVTG